MERKEMINLDRRFIPCRMENEQTKHIQDHIEESVEAKMDDVYKEINNASVLLHVDGNDLVIRIPYLSGDAEDIINTVKCKHDDVMTQPAYTELISQGGD